MTFAVGTGLKFDADGSEANLIALATHRLVLVQFRGKKVILHAGGYTATIRRDAFKALVASNKKYRKRNRVDTRRTPKLKLVVNNPPRDTIKEEAA